MNGWKKYEGYVNDKKIYTINFNKNLMKKILSVTLAGTINVITITGCSFSQKEVALNNDIIEIVKYTSIDEELEQKIYFVESVLNLLNDADPNLQNLIMEPYKEAKRIEYDIDPDNEYYSFMTEEELTSNKRKMINNLDESIRFIERFTSNRLGIDHIKITKTK